MNGLIPGLPSFVGLGGSEFQFHVEWLHGEHGYIQKNLAIKVFN
jgi:hypothetical protein